MLIDYPDVPASVGRFEGEAFNPEKWKPEYPNPAFDIMRPDDAFWAARIVARFSDAMVRGVVAKAQYTDPKATDYISATLIKRRDKVLDTWLNQVNPVVDVTLDNAGVLTFRNAAVDAKAATPADSYAVRWFRLDNAVDTRTDVGEQAIVTDLRAAAPPELLSDGGDYVGVTVTATHSKQPGWARPATFYFRRAGNAWQTVGVER
jgi:hypothetical protein